MAKCKTCQNNNSGIYGLGDANISLLAGAAVGVVASKNVAPMLLDKVAFLQTNPMLKSAVKIAAGYVLAGMESEVVQGIGVGMAAEAAGTLIGSYLPANMGGSPAVGMVTPAQNVMPQNQYQVGTRPLTIAGMDGRVMNWADAPVQNIAGTPEVKLHA